MYVFFCFFYFKEKFCFLFFFYFKKKVFVSIVIEGLEGAELGEVKQIKKRIFQHVFAPADALCYRITAVDNVTPRVII